MSCNAKDGLGNTLYVLLGFGGTGGKTIAQLAEVATHDPIAAELIRSRVHIVLCDTDVGELCSSHNDILKEFNSRVPGGAPPVETFALGAGSDVFQDLVQQRFQSAKSSGTNGSGLRAFRDHWWHDPQGQPFSAHRMPMAINAGAAQCPMVSHFLAWDSLDRFERVLQEITDVAMNERGMENFMVELFLVSSLAGGTGRGCWQLLSLKAREFFGARKQACRPTGFFVDASAFEDLMKNRPDQRIKLQVNALTGLSELSMWLKDPQGPELKFILPDLSEPADDQVASINTEKFMPEAEVARKGRNPVHRAYVFTSRSDSVFLDSPKGVYRACAASIYSKLSMKQARSADANSPARAVATATNILFVPVSDIQKVFRIAAKGQRARRFLEGRVTVKDGDSSKKLVAMAKVTTSNEAIQVAITPGTSVEGTINDLCTAIKTFCQFPEDTNQLKSKWGEGNGSPFNGKGCNILGSLIGHYEGSKRKALEVIAANIRKGEQDLRRVLERFCGDVGSNGDIEGVFWASAITALTSDQAIQPLRGSADSKTNSTSLKQKFGDDFFQALVYGGLPILAGNDRRAKSLKELAGSGVETGSPAVLHHVVDCLLTKVKETIEAVGKAEKEFTEKRKTKAAALEQIMEEYKRKQRLVSRIPVLKSFFSPLSREDIVHIQGVVFAEILNVAYPKILSEYKSMLKIIEEQLSRVRSRSKAMVESVVRMQTNQEKIANTERESCFTLTGKPEDMQRELKALKNDNSIPVARVVRKLRPIFSASSFEDSVRKAIENDQKNEPLNDESLWLCELTDQEGKGLHLFGKELTSPVDVSRFQGRIFSGLEAILDRQTIDNRDLEEEFALTRVIEGFVAYWAEQYQTGNLNTQADISKAVEDVLGVSLSSLMKTAQDSAIRDGITAGKEVPLPTRLEMVASSAIRMALKCDPLVQFGHSSGHRGDTVTVFLPKLSMDEKLNKDQMEQVTNRIRLDSRHMKDCINHISVDTKGENPYMMVVSTDTPKGDFDSRGWDGWESFNYWRTDADIKRWLLMAEDTSGKSVFCHDDDSIGLGYLSPQYVRNPYFANRRWRPWVDGRLTDRKWKALAYALIGNDLYRNPKVASQITEKPFWQSYQNFKKVVSNLSFNRNHPDEKISLPLLLEAPGGDGPSFQRRLLAKDSSGELRLVGLDVGPSAGSLYQFRSIRSFIDWFYAASGSEKEGRQQTSDEVFDRIWEECLNLGELLRQPERLPDPEVREHVHAIRSPETRDAVNEFIREYVREWLEYTEKNVSREDDRQQQVKFLKEFQSVLEKGDVLGIFDLDPAGGK